MQLKFGPVQNEYFNATDGAYSKVTATEEEDGQITLTGHEKKIAETFFGPGGIHRGNVSSNRPASLRKFLLYGSNGKLSEVELPLVYCKPDKNELRLYLKAGGFKPEPESIWFICVSSDRLVIGTVPETKWRSLGREDDDDENYIADIYEEPKAIQYQKVTGGLILRRDPKIAKVRFKIANYRCEVDPGHKFFTSRATKSPFLEAHHLLPMKHQKNFTDSLDVKDNLAALCPYCHRLIHHATVKETRPILDTLFSTRGSLTEKFKVDKIALYRFYNCEEILAD